jgi:DNA polymerase-1
MQTQLFTPPTSEWELSKTLPRTFGKRFALDVETFDPYLKDRGPGFKYGIGYIVGIALANDTESIYLPIRHSSSQNYDIATVMGYLQRLLDEADEVMMANATYDLGWLLQEGITCRSTVRDIQVAEALIDEEKITYSLSSLAKEYLHTNKDETLLLEASRFYGVHEKNELYQLPAKYVAMYAEEDARLTYRIYEKQTPILREKELWQIWELECAVTPILVNMTKKGVPVNLEKASELNDRLRKEETELMAHVGIDIWSPKQVVEYCRKLNLPIPKTDKGNDSVNKGFFDKYCNDHPELERLRSLRELNRLRKVFIEDLILNGNYKGRIHASFIQTARDDSGTRSGRLSCKHPNLQQIPKRSKIGKEIRKLFYCYGDNALWAKLDYNSQEPRLQVHYALLLGLPKADEAAEAFIAGKKLYTFFEEQTGLPYDICKALFLGKGYGMGKNKMSEMIKRSLTETEEIIERFDIMAPFIKILFQRLSEKAAERGYIKTILGRRSNFDWWVPKGERSCTPVKGYCHAKDKFDGKQLMRAFVSKALNRLIQGSAADQTKKAMVDCYRAGFDIRLPVHDEINAFVSTEQEAFSIKELMETTIKLKLPVKADLELGQTWT